MRHLMLISIFVLFVIHNLYYTSVNATYDFTTVPLWKSSHYPCNTENKSLKLNLIVMLPAKRKTPEMKSFLSKTQGQIFNKLREGFSTIYTYYYEYQLHNANIRCKRYSWDESSPPRGMNGDYRYNHDWLWYRVESCAFWDLSLRPPPSIEWRHMLVVFHESIPFYDKVKTVVLPSDRLPYPVYGYKLNSVFRSKGVDPLFIVLESSVDEWLKFSNMLQIPSREVVTIKGDRTPLDMHKAAINLVCLSRVKPSNDYLLNYYDRLAFRYQDEFKGVPDEYRVYFVLLAPQRLYADIFDLFETDLSYYDGWSSFYLVLRTRFPNSRLGALGYNSTEDSQSSCIGIKNFVDLDNLETELYPHPMEKSRNTDVGKHRYVVVGECIKRLMETDMHDTKKRLLMIIAFDYKERFYEDPGTINNNEDDIRAGFNHYIGKFLYNINTVISHTEYVVAKTGDQASIHGTKNGLEHMLEYGHHKGTTRISAWSTYTTMLTGVLNSMEGLIKRSMLDDKMSKRLKGLIWPKKLKHKIYLNILIQFPQKLPMEIVPSLPQFFDDDYKLFKNFFQQQFNPENIRIAVSRYKNFFGEKDDVAHNTTCRVIKALERNLHDPIELFESLIVGYKKNVYADYPYKQTYNCAKVFDEWVDTPKETTLNIIIAIIDTLPIENFNFITEGKKPTEDPTESHVWRKYLDAAKDKYIIYAPAPSLIKRFPTRTQYSYNLPAETYKQNEWASFHTAMADAIFSVANRTMLQPL